MSLIKGLKQKGEVQLDFALPSSYKKDIKKAIIILQKIGFSELYLFGSLVRGDFTKNSDIDFAIKGLSNDKFHYALGKLDYELKHRVDLVNLDQETPFIKILKKELLVKIV